MPISRVFGWQVTHFTVSLDASGMRVSVCEHTGEVVLVVGQHSFPTELAPLCPLLPASPLSCFLRAVLSEGEAREIMLSVTQWNHRDS